MTITAMNERITPITTPYIVPNNKTPKNAPTNIANSVWSVFHNLTASPNSVIPISAATTIPVSIGTGRYSSTGVPKSTIRSIVREAVIDITCDLQPNWSAIPVLDTLPFKGHPPITAEAAFAAA